MKQSSDRHSESSPLHSAAGAASPASHSELIDQLSSPNVAVRERARQTLIVFGAGSVDDLTAALRTADAHGRLEAAKALAEIAAPSAVPALVAALESHEPDVRWVAAEGLVNTGAASVEPLLTALIDRASGFTILDGAHHVLYALARRTIEPIFEPVLAAIRSSEPGVSVPPAAEHALIRWRQLSAELADGRREYPLRALHKKTHAPLL